MLTVHHLNNSAFQSNGHHGSIGPHAERTDSISKGGDFLDDLALLGVVEMDSPAEGVEELLLGVGIGRDRGDGVGEPVHLFGLVLLPETLLVGELVPRV